MARAPPTNPARTLDNRAWPAASHGCTRGMSRTLRFAGHLLIFSLPWIPLPFIVASVDVQKNRLVYVIRGWGGGDFLAIETVRDGPSIAGRAEVADRFV